MPDVSRYWYDPNTGEIQRRTLAKGTKKFNLPYFDRAEPGWNWSDFRVDVETGKIIPKDNPLGQGIDPRRPNTVDPNTVNEP